MHWTFSRGPDLEQKTERNRLRYVVVLILVIAALFNLTVFFPAPEAWPLQPFGVETTSWLGFGLMEAPGSLVAPLLGGLGALAFVAAALSLVGFLFPQHWFGGLVVGGALCTLLLFGLFLNVMGLLPIVLSLFMLYGVLSRNWTPDTLSEDSAH